MRNNQNKHGPDVDVGRRYTWLRTPDVLTGLPPPWKVTKDRCGPGLKLRIADCRLRIEEIGLPVELLFNRKSKIENPKLNGPPSPDPRPPEKDWPPGSSISQKRRRQRPRSTIVNRRTGESPPGIVDDLITSNIDSIAQRKRTIRGCILQGRKRLFYP
jgi:hypothetical protein